MDSMNNAQTCQTPGEAANLRSRWSALIEAASSTEKIPDGVAIVVPSRLRTEVSNLITDEQNCCPSLQASLYETNDEITVSLTSADRTEQGMITAFLREKAHSG